MEDKKKSGGGLKFSPAWKGGTLIIFFLILYTLYHIIFGLSASVQTTAAGLVREESSVVLEGIIFRDEQVILNKNEGNIYPYLENGERIESGGKVGELCHSSKYSLYEKISQLKQELYILEHSNDKSLYSVVDIQETEKQIEELYTALMKALATRDTYRATKIEQQLLIFLNKMEIYKGNVKNYDAQISQLKSELERLYSNVKGSKEYVYADIGGYVYYECDGYEDELAFENLDVISVEHLVNLTNKVKSNPIKSSDYICKIVYSHTWYLSSACDRQTASSLSEGNIYTITLFGTRERQIDVKLEKIVDNGIKNVMLVFSCEVMPEDFDYLRYQEFKLDILETEGYRVPQTAVQSIQDDNGNKITGVYILDGSVVRFKKITIIAEKDGYYIVSKNNNKEYLHLNERIILDPAGMYEGKILKK